MPEVDFYVLGDSGEQGLLRVACRIAEKAWLQGLAVYVLAEDDEHAQRIDDALWTFRDEGFVPHERWSGTGTPEAPVLVGACTDVAGIPDVLVNVGAPPPSWHDRCARIAEVVGGDAGRRARGRDAYRLYREAGMELRTHEV